MTDGKRTIGFYLLAGFFGLYVLFLYGPTITITVLSFQGPNGGLTFPMNGHSLHWFANLFQPQLVGDFGGSLRRSLLLGGMVMVTTVVVSLAAGLAYRNRFRGDTPLFYLAVASLVVPSILVSLGVGLLFSQLGMDTAWYASAFGAQLTWTLPFGLLIMFAVFSRFNPSYEEAARDLGATSWQSLRHVVLPIIAPSILGVALFGFTLSYDEFARTLLTAGSDNTLPLEIYGMTTNITTPVLYALGTVTTGFSFIVIGSCIAAVVIMQRRRAPARRLMRILVVNPNTTATMTDKIAVSARAAAAAGTIVDAVTSAMGPDSIEGYYDEAFAVPGLVQAVMAGERAGADGAAIACFDDTGLDAARCAVAIPVVGICEAAIHLVSPLAHRFSIVTTLSRSIPPLEALTARYGVAHRCRVRAAEVPVLALEDGASDAVAKVEREIALALREDRAEAVILGCAGMTDLAALLSRKFGVPVIDGVAAAVKLIEALAGLGLRTSKIGGYAAPLSKTYLGAMAPFAPKSR